MTETGGDRPAASAVAHIGASLGVLLADRVGLEQPVCGGRVAPVDDRVDDAHATIRRAESVFRVALVAAGTAAAAVDGVGLAVALVFAIATTAGQQDRSQQGRPDDIVTDSGRVAHPNLRRHCTASPGSGQPLSKSPGRH